MQIQVRQNLRERARKRTKKGHLGMKDEPENFLLVLPIPQRVVLLVVLGVWLYFWFLKIASKYLSVNKVLVIDEVDLPHNLNMRQVEKRVLNLAKSVTKIILPLQLLWVIFVRYAVKEEIKSKLILFVLNAIPLLEMVFILMTILRSSPMLQRCLKKILWFADVEPRPYRNNYIIISDTLTSYSRPLVDFTMYLIFLASEPANINCHFEHPANAVGINIDLLVGVFPAVIRLLQCLREHMRQDSEKDNTQLYNAFKYFGNIPIMCLTVYARFYDIKTTNWIYMVMFWNSLYTFWWDLTMDWKLDVFNFTKDSSLHILRKNLSFQSPAVYYLAIAIDFSLRFIWYWQYITGKSIFYGELNTFCIQALEIIRRWAWIFFKVDAEYVEMLEDTK